MVHAALGRTPQALAPLQVSRGHLGDQSDASVCTTNTLTAFGSLVHAAQSWPAPATPSTGSTSSSSSVAASPDTIGLNSVQSVPVAAPMRTHSMVLMHMTKDNPHHENTALHINLQTKSLHAILKHSNLQIGMLQWMLSLMPSCKINRGGLYPCLHP